MPEKLDFQPIDFKAESGGIDFQPDVAPSIVRQKPSNNTEWWRTPISKAIPGIESALQGRMQNIANEPFTLGNILNFRQPLHVAGELAGGVTDTLGNIIKQIIPSGIKDAFSRAGTDFSNMINPSFKKSATDAIESVPSELKKDLGSALNIASLIPGGAAYKEVIGMGEKIAPLAAKDSAKGAFKSTVKSGIEKGVRPSVVGRKTAPLAEKYMSNAEDAVTSIIKNKPNLKFTTPEGEAIAGQLPKNLYQFSDAITQTKQKIFAEYDAMAKQTGAQRVMVDLAPVEQELKAIIADITLQDTRPSTIKYAEDFLTRIQNRGIYYSPDEAQAAISKLNEGLKNFYRNPTMGDTSAAYVDSQVAKALRKSLDDAITNTTGSGYQQLKNQYGALRAIEEDVSHRAAIDARKNVKGLIDFTDIYSSPEILYGILTGNPAVVAKGGIMRGIKELYKYNNNPNTIVSRMFSRAEKFQQPAQSMSPMVNKP